MTEQSMSELSPEQRERVEGAIRHFDAVTPDTDDDPGWCHELAAALRATLDALDTAQARAARRSARAHASSAMLGQRGQPKSAVCPQLSDPRLRFLWTAADQAVSKSLARATRAEHQAREYREALQEIARHTHGSPATAMDLALIARATLNPTPSGADEPTPSTAGEEN